MVRQITDREHEAIELVAHGMTHRQIADIMHISEKTLEQHLASAKEKLNARNSPHLVAQAFRNGVLMAICCISVCNILAATDSAIRPRRVGGRRTVQVSRLRIASVRCRDWGIYSNNHPILSV